MEVPKLCLSNQTLMALVNAKDLMNNATYTDPEVVQANFRDPNFNDSLCYEKLSESEAHAFLHYETGWSLVLAYYWVFLRLWACLYH